MKEKFLLLLIVWAGTACSQEASNKRMDSSDFKRVISNHISGQRKALDTLLKVSLNGIEHSVFVKTKNIHNPILLILHGGPGFSDFYFWQNYNKDLEQHFTVVTYDQRGAGLSYNDSISAASMTYHQLTDDAHKLINLLKSSFRQPKVYLVGFAAGTILGVYLSTQYPDDIYAFVSVGQVVNGRENEKLCLQYTTNEARKANDQVALAELKPLKNSYPSGNVESDLRSLKILRKWNRVYHGDFCSGSSMDKLFGGIDSLILKNVNYELLNKGEAFSMSLLWGEVMDLDLLQSHKNFKIPVYFMVGRCDYNTPFVLTETYYKTIKAPVKKIFYFEKSGHYIPFVEPKKFNAILVAELVKNQKSKVIL